MRASPSAYPTLSPGTKSPSHLVLRNGTWHFRMAVPTPCRPRLGGLNEFKASLRTGVLREAKLLAGKLAANAHLVYRHVQKDSIPMGNLDKKTIRALAKKWLLEGLDYYEAEHLSRDKPVNAEMREARKASLESMAAYYQEQLAAGDFSCVNPDWVAERLERENLPIPEKDSLEFKMLTAEFMKATVDLSKIQANRTIGDYSDSLTADPIPSNSVEAVAVVRSADIASKSVDPAPDNLLSDVLDRYIEGRIRAGAWTERSQADFLPKLQFFKQQVGNIAIEKLSREHVRDFKLVVDRLPARYGITKKYKELSLEEVLKASIPLDDRMSPSSLSKYYGTINSFLIWLKKNYDGVGEGLSDVLAIKINRQVDALRDVFTEADLAKIFKSEIYAKAGAEKSFKYWIPLLGLYTGMRLEEICQLYVEDLVVEDGLYCLSVNDDKDKKIKTPAAKRLVPLHPDLVDKFKFPDFVAEQKAKKNERLFPELRKQSGRFSHYASRWFNADFLVKVGVKSGDGKKVFHSFRHTFANACKVAGVDEYKAREVLGHDVSGKSITYGRYGKRYSVAILMTDVILKVKVVDV